MRDGDEVEEVRDEQEHGEGGVGGNKEKDKAVTITPTKQNIPKGGD